MIKFLVIIGNVVVFGKICDMLIIEWIEVLYIFEY